MATRLIKDIETEISFQRDGDKAYIRTYDADFNKQLERFAELYPSEVFFVAEIYQDGQAVGKRWTIAKSAICLTFRNDLRKASRTKTAQEV